MRSFVLGSMHSELSYGLLIAPKFQQVGSIHDRYCSLKKKLTSPCHGSDLSSSGRLILNKDSLSGSPVRPVAKFEGLPSRSPVDHSWSSRDTVTAVACFCCCDGADAFATELMLRAARAPPRGAVASSRGAMPAAPRGGTRRRRPVEC